MTMLSCSHCSILYAWRQLLYQGNSRDQGRSLGPAVAILSSFIVLLCFRCLRSRGHERPKKTLLRSVTSCTYFKSDRSCSSQQSKYSMHTFYTTHCYREVQCVLLVCIYSLPRHIKHIFFPSWKTSRKVHLLLNTVPCGLLNPQKRYFANNGMRFITCLGWDSLVGMAGPSGDWIPVEGASVSAPVRTASYQHTQYWHKNNT
jgi:hypothetical protein